jgi:hypothetical protein
VVFLVQVAPASVQELRQGDDTEHVGGVGPVHDEGAGDVLTGQFVGDLAQGVCSPRVIWSMRPWPRSPAADHPPDGDRVALRRTC